jgi:hypothetical protein
MQLSAGEIDDAISEFEAVVGIDPENKSAQMYLKIARTQRGRSEQPAS